MLAVVLALAAAAVFGTATALQHRAASGVTRAEVASGRLLVRLLRRRSWLLGIGLSGVAFALHVAALHEGPLRVVQPIVVTTTVFAVFVRAGLDRTRPDLAEIAWAVVTCAGLTLFVVSAAAPVPHHPPGGREGALFAGVAVLVAASAALLSRATEVPARRGFLLGVAAGILYGLTAGLIKMATSSPGRGHGPGLGHGPGPGPGPGAGLGALLRHWPVWLVPPVGLTAFSLSQRAYQATRLSVSVPVLNIVDVLVAVTFGSVVFGDRLFTTPGRLLAEVVGVSMMAVGVWRLVREDERLHAEQLRSAGPGASEGDRTAASEVPERP